jgi:predicted RNA-binding protein YlxR (DUF448 family)
VRLSVDAAGALAIGRGAGRGTYLCPSAECVDAAVRSRAIPRRLRTSVEIPEGLAALVIAALPGG